MNALIVTSIQNGHAVEVFTASPPDLEWCGWKISAAEGLEAGLIKTFQLPWNARESIRASPPSTIMQMEAARLAIPPSLDLVNANVGKSPLAGKYHPLREYLSASTQKQVSLSFGQIETLVGKLPKSAFLHQAWWGNHDGNVQAKSWMGAGYLVEANPSRRSVTFRKFSR